MEEKDMRITLLIAGAVSAALTVTAVFAQSASNDATRKRYLSLSIPNPAI
jgi:hypothetical protein